MLIVACQLTVLLLLPTFEARAADAPRPADTLPIVTNADGSRTMKCLDHSPSLAEAERVRKERDEILARKDGQSWFSYPVTIDVVWHSIYGLDEWVSVTPEEVQDQIDVLNDRFDEIGISFVLKSFSLRYNPDWEDLDLGGGYTEEWDMKSSEVNLVVDPPARTLHVFSVGTIYDHDLGLEVQGSAVFPWEGGDEPHMDGIIINQGQLPHWGAQEGEELVHEIGHYLGLFHTFENHGNDNGCIGPGDYISDTPAEWEAHWWCYELDTCPDDPGNDPIHNFMDYSRDDCRTHFTEEQKVRMKDHLEAYRSLFFPQFVDATPAITAFDTNEPTSIAVGDFDADGLQDLAVTFYHGTGLAVFENDGAGSYVEHVLYVNWPEGTALDISAGDYDNDGDQDLFLLYDEGLKIFRNDGNMSFAEVGELDVIGQGECSLVDFNNDGRLDLFHMLGGDWHQSVLYENTPEGFVDVTPAVFEYSSYTQYRNAWGDYDGDGDQDLYIGVLNQQGLPNRLLRNDGAAGFTELLDSDVADSGENGGVEWVDYDGDGRLDLSVTNRNGACRLFRNLGGGSFTDVATGPLASSDDEQAAAWGDYDNDGDLDVYLCRFSYDAGLGHNVLLRQESDGSFVDSGVETDANSLHTRRAVWTDHDADGDLDLIVLNRDNETSFLYENDRLAAGNHWLRVKLAGTVSNRDGVGARIHLTTAAGQQTREITAGGNNLGQMATVAHFGLGGATTVTGLEVHWPSGIVQDVLAQGPVGIDGTVTVTEPNHRITSWIDRLGTPTPLEGNRIYGCPAGDGYDELVVEVDFDDASVGGVPVIQPADVALDLSVLGLSFCDVPYGDEAGTPGNGYKVVLRRRSLSGCTDCQTDECTNVGQYRGTAFVNWLGTPVGRIADLTAASTDPSGDGYVSVLDLATFANEMYLYEDDPGFTGCADLAPDGYVDVLDFGRFATHLGHGCSSAKNGNQLAGLPVAGSRIVFQTRSGVTAAGRLTIDVMLEGGDQDGVTAYNFAVDCLDPAAGIGAWQPAAGDDLLSVFNRIDVEGRSLGQVTGLVGVGGRGSRVLVGTLELERPAGADPQAGDAAVSLAFGSVLTADGLEKSLVGDGAQAPPQITRSGVVRVYPNPFNPATNIEYAVARRSHVKIRIYDISGRLVRTLVDEVQEGGSTLRNARWTGTDASGRSVSSGVYFWRFSAGDQVQTGRALLLK